MSDFTVEADAQTQAITDALAGAGTDWLGLSAPELIFNPYRLEPLPRQVDYRWHFQEFFLPDNFVRGEGGEALIPDVSGIQIKANIRKGYKHAAALDWSFSHKEDTEDQWEVLAEGTHIAVAEDGNEVWVTINFEEPVVITPEILGHRFQLGLRGRDPGAPNIIAKRCQLDPFFRWAMIEGRRFYFPLTPNRRVYQFEWEGWPCHIIWNYGWDYCYFYVQQGVDWIYASDGGGLETIPFIERAFVWDNAPWGGEFITSVPANALSFRWYRPIKMDNGSGYDPINSVLNPSLEVDARGWAGSVSGAGSSLTSTNRIRTSAASGRWVYEVVGNPGSNAGFVTATMDRTIAAEAKEGDEVWVAISGNLTTANAGGSLQCFARYMDASGAVLSDDVVHTITNPALGAWQGLEGASQAPAGTAYVGVGVRATGQNNTATRLLADAAMVVVDPDPDPGFDTPGYFDGDTINARWLGRPHFSKSQIRTPGVAFYFRLLTLTGDSGTDALGNEYRYVVRRHKVDDVDTYNGGEVNDKFWLSKPNPSQFAVESLYIDARDEDGNASVVDRILIDPTTPNVYANIYYSNEDHPNDAELLPGDDLWDEKLWTRVPRNYRLTKRDTYALPAPVTAKYIKIEFTQLQALPLEDYVDMDMPIRYKKHPKWVLDYFVARTAAKSTTEDEFVADSATVIYDQLDLAYHYYLDDIRQYPDRIVAPNTSEKARLNEFLSERADASDQVNPDTLLRIKTAMRPYQSQPGVWYTDSLLAWYSSAAPVQDYPVERGDQYLVADTSAVSHPRREAVVFEQSMPVMYFFIPSRHRYREVEATLNGKIGYFVGIREVALFRDHYTKASDTPAYIEVGGDQVNIERNDFVSSEGLFVTS